MMRPGKSGWSAAFAGALLVHAAIVGVLFWNPVETGASGAGVGGVEVSLGPAGGTPGAAAPEPGEITEAAPVEPVEAEPVEAVEAPEPEPLDPIETVEAEPVEAQPVEPEPVEPQIVETESVEIETVEAVESDLIETAVLPTPHVSPSPPNEIPPEPKPEPKPEPVAETTQEAVPETAAEPEPQASDEPEPSREPQNALQEALNAIPDAAEPTQWTAALPGNQGSGNANETGVGAGNGSSGGGNPGAVVDYGAKLLAWLERHKEYPRRARSRRQEGTVMVYLSIARDGSVIEYRIEDSSGHRLLDEATLEMVERASPMPSFPEDLNRSSISLAVPVQFFIR